MLPPLTVADAKRDFFSPRKRTQARRSALGTSLAASANGSSALNHSEASTDSPFSALGTPRTLDAEPAAAAPSSSSLVARLSLIPREFFVVERHSVLPVGQYPPAVYQSSFTGGADGGGGLWETIVFPALAPQTRQQVLYLRSTLEKLRGALLRASAGEDAPGSASASPSPRQRHRIQSAVVEYSKQEARIYSVCFHELTRQVKFICKEQSELLLEVRERYDAIVGRLAERIQQLDAELAHRTERVGQLLSEAADLELANAALRRDNALKAEVIADLELRASSRDDLGGERSEGDEDEAREAEWQRQRRQLASVDAVLSTKKRRDSAVEENLAAARVQTAFHKFQVRKAQHALALRVEKNVAALDIQRSYRGFRDRQRLLHHRAVLQTIMKRRKQVAAVELLQENARAYLLKRRRSLGAKRAASAAASASSESTSAPASAQVDAEAAPLHLTPVSESASEPARQSLALIHDANPSVDLLHLILSSSKELMSAVRQLQTRSQPNSVADVETAAEPATLSTCAPTNAPDPVASEESTDETIAAALIPSDGEEATVLRRALEQTRSLVLSLEKAIASRRSGLAGSLDDLVVTPGSSQPSRSVLVDPPEARDVTSVGVSTSTLSLDSVVLSSGNTEVEPKMPTAHETDKVQSEAALPPETREAAAEQGGIQHRDGDWPGASATTFHIDDSLWRSATFYASTGRASDAEAQQRLLAYVATREQRKRLVQLKQFMSDIYATIVGRMRELPPRHLADAVRLPASLALSCDEWRQQRRLVLHDTASDASATWGVAAAIPLDLDAMSREHFRCQLGLSNLVEAAMQELYAAVECFAPVDPDVEAFRGFLARERPVDELEFCCACRFLCAQAGSSLAASRQPVFHPVTMREVLPAASALGLARRLFRVDEQDAVTSSDARYVEVDNAVYRRFLPASGFQQCQEIVTTYLPAATDGAVPPLPTSPRASMAALTRPTNCGQFHAKQYNSTASRSPLVRRPHPQPPAASPRPLSATAADADKWVYLDDVLALLLQYRAEMRSFHLFLNWATELFALAADPTAASSAAPPSAAVSSVSERAFVAALAPLSLGPSARELRSLFANALRQRHLQRLMPLRTFTSVVLLLLENRMISVGVASHAPPDRQRRARSAGLRALLQASAPADPSAARGAHNARSGDCARAWRVLATQWRAREAGFEAAVEALAQAEDPDGYRRALRLLQLRDELLELLAGRVPSALLRGLEVYEELADALADALADSDGASAAPGGVETSASDGAGEGDEAPDDGDWSGEAADRRGDSPWPTDAPPSTCGD